MLLPRQSDAASPPLNQVHITSDNLGPVVVIVAILMVIVSFFAVFTRVVAKLVKTRSLSIDEQLIIAALVFSGAQSVAVGLAVSKGLGKHESSLSDGLINDALRDFWVSNILYFCASTTAKISAVLLIRGLTPVRVHRKLAIFFGVLVLLWGLTSLLITAFQCNQPTPWSLVPSKCLRVFALTEYIDVFNLLLEVILVVWPMTVFMGIQTNLRKRLVIAACFASRITVIGAIAAQLVVLNRTSYTTDRTSGFWALAVTNQFVQCLTIVATCVPYLKPFFENLQSGVMRNDELEHRSNAGTYYGYGYGRQAGNNSGSGGTKGSVHTNTTTSSGNRKSQIGKPIYLENIVRRRTDNGNATVVAATKGERDPDAESQTSQSRIIKETKTWTVNVEEHHSHTGDDTISRSPTE